MPSGSAIILLTCTARLLLFPLLIQARRKIVLFRATIYYVFLIMRIESFFTGHQAHAAAVAPEFQKALQLRKEAVAIGDDYASNLIKLSFSVIFLIHLISFQ